MALQTNIQSLQSGYVQPIQELNKVLQPYLTQEQTNLMNKFENFNKILDSIFNKISESKMNNNTYYDDIKLLKEPILEVINSLEFIKEEAKIKIVEKLNLDEINLKEIIEIIFNHQSYDIDKLKRNKTSGGAKFLKKISINSLADLLGDIRSTIGINVILQFLGFEQDMSHTCQNIIGLRIVMIPVFNEILKYIYDFRRYYLILTFFIVGAIRFITNMSLIALIDENNVSNSNINYYLPYLLLFVFVHYIKKKLEKEIKNDEEIENEKNNLEDIKNQINDLKTESKQLLISYLNDEKILDTDYFKILHEDDENKNKYFQLKEENLEDKKLGGFSQNILDSSIYIFNKLSNKASIFLNYDKLTNTFSNILGNKIKKEDIFKKIILTYKPKELNKFNYFNKLIGLFILLVIMIIVLMHYLFIL